MDGNLALKQEELYTYEDYLTWNGAERWELIDGYAYLMAAASPEHQEISGNFYLALREYLKGKSCKAYQDIDVRLFPEKEAAREVVVRPDLSVICNQEQLNAKGCNGAPNLIIEILSPSNQRVDRYIKFKRYFQAGVREYWIVDPESKVVQVNLLEGKRYMVMICEVADTLRCTVLPGLEIQLRDIFPGD